MIRWEARLDAESTEKAPGRSKELLGKRGRLPGVRLEGGGPSNQPPARPGSRGAGSGSTCLGAPTLRLLGAPEAGSCCPLCGSQTPRCWVLSAETPGGGTARKSWGRADRGQGAGAGTEPLHRAPRVARSLLPRLWAAAPGGHVSRPRGGAAIRWQCPGLRCYVILRAGASLGSLECSLRGGRVGVLGAQGNWSPLSSLL